MDLKSIVISCIASAGGVSGIIIVAIRLSSNFIAERLAAKYDHRLEKAMEKYKTELSQKQYVSQVRFDAEFEIYRTLSKEFSIAVKNISIMFPIGFSFSSSDEKKTFEDAENAFIAAQDALYANGAFISEELYNKYYEILKLCKKQLNAFQLRFSASRDKNVEYKEEKEFKRTEIIGQKWLELNNCVREYLLKLDVIN